ncbi:MAG: Smr/MutS family protein [Treponema sp.]|nr:Smr/MutS family protein [Treponema sp.]
MNFGDILDEWDRQTAKNRGKKAVSQKEAVSLPKTDPLTVWLRVNGVYDKDAEAEAQQVSTGERRRRLLTKGPDAVIDLHGLTQDEAWNSLESFFRDGKKQGFEKLLIIHGKGNHSEREGVLKETVRKFIERCPFAGESGYGNALQGGRGSTWVFLKNIKGGP